MVRSKRSLRVITIINNDLITIIDFAVGVSFRSPFADGERNGFLRSSAETMPTSRRAADLASLLERLQHLA